MRILYGINGTGNGHRSRAKDLVPALAKDADLDVIVSGVAYSLPMPFPVKHTFPGVSFTYRDGSVDMMASARKSNPVRLLRDIAGLEVSDYDLVISDFEPVSAWAARLRGVPSLHVSHQASFLSRRVPRPRKKDHVSELFIRHFSPGLEAIGLHFRRYAEHVRPPIVREEIRAYRPGKGSGVVAYLPAVRQDELIDCLNGLNGQFTVFSRECGTAEDLTPNIRIEPPSETRFAEAMAEASGVIGHSGFELPSEAMYLRKSMLSMPIGGQYEQQCNAAALKRLGVDVVWKWDTNVRKQVADWLSRMPVVPMPEITLPEELAAEILSPSCRKG